MRRREFITLLGGAAAAWPLAARAQQRSQPIVGFLSAGVLSEDNAAGFRRGLRELGFVEGQNLSIEHRFAENQEQRLPGMAAELVRRQVAVIVATPNRFAIGAARDATATTPIVFLSGPDPVRTGIVASLNRPGGNLTGVTLLSADLTAKRLGLLHDTVPQITAVAMLLGRPSVQNEPEFQLMEAQTAGRNIGLRIFGVEAGTQDEFETALASASAGGAGALLVSTTAFFVNNRERVVALAAKHKLPAIYQTREYATAGGLMSYGPSLTDAYRQIGVYTGRILRGEKPADLPVMLPTKFEFIINLKTAKTLGLTIPPGLLAIVDQVIE